MTATPHLRGALLAAGLVLAGAAEARVTRIEINRAEAAEPGSAGPQERITGRAFGELDPADPANAIITDIALASRTGEWDTWRASS